MRIGSREPRPVVRGWAAPHLLGGFGLAQMLVAGVLILAGALTGCEQKRSNVAPAEGSAIPISQPVQRDVTDYVDFTGRTDAIQSTDIRARVTGYLRDRA